ncbi:hypothetical protein LTR65_002937 [Meristemomyces frigidus]
MADNNMDRAAAQPTEAQRGPAPSTAANDADTQAPVPTPGANAGAAAPTQTPAAQTPATQTPAPSAPESESELSRSLRDNMERFALDGPAGLSPLQVATGYRKALWAQQFKAMTTGGEVELRGELFAWLDAYIAHLRNGGQP